MELDLSRFNCSIDLQKQRELFEICFPETRKTSVATERHYFWKFHSKPGFIHSNEFSATINKKLIGYYAAIPFYYKFKNETLTAAMVCDVMTGPEARGKGVFTKLGSYSTDQLANSGYNLSTGFPIRPEVIPGHLKVGWEKAFELPLFAKVVSSRAFLTNRGLGFFSFFFDFLLRSAERLCGRAIAYQNDHLTTNIYNFNGLEEIPDLYEFYKNWEKSIPIALIKDSAFLKWRLGGPEKSYCILTLRKNKKLIGVLIASQTIKKGIPCMGILDLTMLEEYSDMAPVLLKELAVFCRKLKIDLILMMMSKYWSKKYKIKKSLFFRTPFAFYFIVKLFQVNGHEQEVKEESNWHVMWIDSDDL
jgi:hypothetical protein